MVSLFQANPAVGKDQPPDLAVYVPSCSVVVPELPNKTSSVQTSPPNNVSADIKPVASGMADVIRFWPCAPNFMALMRIYFC